MSITFGTALRHIRKARGLTLTQIAERIGVSYPAVQQWEADRTTPSGENLKKLSDTVGARLQSLITHIGRQDRGEGIKDEDVIDYANFLMEEFDEERSIEAAAVSQNLDPRFYKHYVSKMKQLRYERDHLLRDKQRFGMSYDLLPIGEVLPPVGSEDFIMSGNVIDYVYRPIGMVKNLRSFGVYAPDSRLSPKFEIGSLIIFNDNVLPEINDFAVIFKSVGSLGGPGPCYLRQIISIDETEIRGFQLSPQRHDRFLRAEGYEAYRIATVNDMLSLGMKAE